MNDNYTDGAWKSKVIWSTFGNCNTIDVSYFQNKYNFEIRWNWSTIFLGSPLFTGILHKNRILSKKKKKVIVKINYSSLTSEPKIIKINTKLIQWVLNYTSRFCRIIFRALCCNCTTSYKVYTLRGTPKS